LGYTIFTVSNARAMCVVYSRFIANARKEQDYKTPNYHIHSTRSQHSSQRMFSEVKADVNGHEAADLQAIEQTPMYLVFDRNNSVNSINRNVPN